VDTSFLCVPQVPSSTPDLVELFLDMVGENQNMHPLPSEDMFKDRDNTYQFSAKIAGYLQGMSTRACANIFTPQGGGAGSNNATESQNKVSHKQMPVKRGALSHVAMLLQHMQLISLADCDFSDVFRNDIWHHDLFIAVWHLMNFVAFPGNPLCIGFNVMLLAIFESLSIDSLDPAKIVYVPKPGDTPAHRVMDISQVMKKEEMRCLMIPSYRTLHEMVHHHAHLFLGKPKDSDAAGSAVQRIKTFLQAPCQTQAGKSATGPSWVAQATALFNGDPAATVRKMNLHEWMARSHTMAVLVPLTGKAEITRYLLRFQTGIPNRNIGSVRPGNGCVVNWEKVPATIYYCLCGDHALRGVCLHVLLWLMTHDIVQAPAKWSCDEQLSAVSRGRPSHFKAGSALVKEPVGPGHVQPSRHALSKMAGGMSGTTSLSVTLQALTSSLGTIDMETDSVRKYNVGKHKRRAGNQAGSSRKAKRQQPVKKVAAPTSESDESSITEDDSARGAGKLKRRPGNKNGSSRQARQAQSKRPKKEEAGTDEADDSDFVLPKKARAAKRPSVPSVGSGMRTKQKATFVQPPFQFFASRADLYIAVCKLDRVSRSAKSDILQGMVAFEPCLPVQELVQAALDAEDLDSKALRAALEEAIHERRGEKPAA
jgi:hypothetical protein